MTYTASITAQGQITIPKSIRDRLGLDEPKKVLVEEKGNEIIIRPAPDFFEQYQSITPKRKINWKSVDEAVQRAIAKNAMKGLR